MNIRTILDSINFEIDQKDISIRKLVDRNAELIKTVATIRTLLERAIKNPSHLNQAIYDSINLCRSSFKYTDYSSGQTKMDSPLSDEEKRLPNNLYA